MAEADGRYLAAAVSTMLVWGLEYYDIILFSALAPLFKELFFPASDVLAAAVATWGAFATTYFVRPLGAILFGHIGDRYGRRLSTVLDASAVGLAGLAIGLLPTYQQAGLAAPIALYGLRAVQGLGIGGEAGGGATWALELTPKRLKPYINGLMYSGLSWAVFLASAAVLWARGFYGEAFSAVGWRAVYIIGVAPALIALAIRLFGAESPEWAEAKRRGRLPKVPLAEVRRHLRNFLILILINLGLTIYYYGGSGYWSYLMKDVVAPKLGLSPGAAYNLALELGVWGGLGAVVGELLSGLLVDAVGLRRAFVLPSIGLAAIAPAAAYLAFSMSPYAVHASFIMGLFFGLAAAPQTLYFTELFPVEVRWTAVSLGWNINASIGPLGSLVATLLALWAPPSIGALALAGSVVMLAGAVLTAAGASIRPRGH
ncbi:MAG: MFS transporter [Thermoproteus sp.]|nr:MFS transporter [Thermoproteus sp.]